MSQTAVQLLRQVLFLKAPLFLYPSEIHERMLSVLSVKCVLVIVCVISRWWSVNLLTQQS